MRWLGGKKHTENFSFSLCIRWLGHIFLPLSFLFLKKSQQGSCYPPLSLSPWWESSMSMTQDGIKQGPRKVRQGENRTSSRGGSGQYCLCLSRIHPSFFWSEHLGFPFENVSSPFSVHRVGMSLTHSPTKFWDTGLVNPSFRPQWLVQGWS